MTKGFFDIDVTSDKENQQQDCACFRAAVLSQAHAAALDSAADSTASLLKSAGLTGALPIVTNILYTITVIVVFGILRALPDVGLAKAMENAPGLFYAAIVLVLLSLVLGLYKRFRSSRVFRSEEFQSIQRRSDAAIASAFTSLGVPGDAARVDVICGCYKRRRDALKYVYEKGRSDFDNPEMRVFLADGALQLADPRNRYAIPLSQLQGIRKINKSILLRGWNKDVACGEGRYKAYRLTRNQNGSISAKFCYALDILHDGTLYTLRFPCYELPVFQAYTGLKVSE